MLPSSPSCRILTISSSIILGQNLVERVIATSNVEAVKETTSKDSNDTTNIPWTISNKYYVAPVHFSLEKTDDVTGTHTTDVPACIFVFDPTESFKLEFTSIALELSDADFEVSLAVSVSFNSSTQPSIEEQDAFEAFFREHGFEYVNGQQDATNSQIEHHDVDDMQGIPGLSRIIDALSTILWPSMVQNASSRRSTKTRSVIHAPTEDDGLLSLLNAEKDIQGPKECEMAALEKWLEEGADDDVNLWDGIREASLSSQPPAHSSLDNNFISGFDDNFSDFVSAPLADDPGNPSRKEVQAMSERIFEMRRGQSGDAAADRDPENAFDLSRVLAGLETLKTEIAGIEDEDERRRAAAKVALSVVYGFEDKDDE